MLPKAPPPSAASCRNRYVQNITRFTVVSQGPNSKMKKSFPTDRAKSAPRNTSAFITFLQKEICSKQISVDSHGSGANSKLKKSFPTDRTASAPQSTSAFSTFLQKQICSKQISAYSNKSGGGQQQIEKELSNR